MNALWSLINLLVFIQIVTCRDFYLGMFRKNDFLVAQDVIYKAPLPFGFTTASYGRLFKCPITYFRVVDRLGMSRGPITTIVRGGLRKKFINVRIKSPYKLPISVNIYVGCENKKPSTLRTTLSIKRTTKKTKARVVTDATTPSKVDKETEAIGSSSPSIGESISFSETNIPSSLVTSTPDNSTSNSSTVEPSTPGTNSSNLSTN